MDDNQYMTDAATAAYLGSSVGFVRRLMHTGVLPRAPMPGRLLRFKRSDVLALANGQSAARPADVVPCRRPGDELSER